MRSKSGADARSDISSAMQSVKGNRNQLLPVSVLKEGHCSRWGRKQDENGRGEKHVLGDKPCDSLCLFQIWRH